MANNESYINSSKYTYGEFEKKRIEDRNDAILKIGAAGAGITAAYYLLEAQQVQTAASKLFKLDILKDYIQFNQYNWRELPLNPKVTLGDLTLGFVKGMEEISPFKVLRTFHASSFLSPAVMAKETKAVTVTATQLFLDEEYIRRLISVNSPSVAPDVVNELFRSGAIYKSGKLYSADQSTEILSHARIVDLAPDIARGSGEKSSPFLNRVYEKFRNVLGVEERSKFFNAAFSDSGGIGIIAGKSNLDIAQKWTRAYGRLAVEPGFKVFDKPADFLAELVDKTGLPERYNLFTGLRDKLALNAGTAGDYTKSVPRSFYISAKNTAKITAKGTIAYTALDAIVRSIAGEDSPYDKGIAAGLATAYVDTRIGIAEKWSDNFQGYKERQEYYAPGSTSLIALSGFPLAGAMLGATIGYSTRVKDVAREGFAGSERIFSRESQSGLVNKVLGRSGADAPMMNKTKKFAAIGAIIAAIPALPFLPGAIIGESSEKLKAQYSGEEEVAIRSTRFWTSGGTEYGGGKIKYYTRSWYNQLMDNAEDIGRYGDIETKDKLNPYLNPFDYIRNPYQYEELNQDKTPYPVWGMSVSQGGALGKLYEMTIGALIKPNIVNDRLDDYITGGSLHSSRGVELKTKVSQKEESLVNDGMMLAPEAAKLNTLEEGASSAYKALTDFAGLKGWVISLLNEGTHTGLEDVGKQLAKSGESSNVAREILERNLGGMGPVGESLRRFIPTNAGSVEANINPLRNLMPCLLKGTEVVLEGNILVKAEDLKIGDRIISDTGTIEEVTNVAIFKTNKTVEIKVYGTNLYRFDFSWNHPLLVYGKGYVNAEDVLVNDYVAYPITRYSKDAKIIDISELTNEWSFVDDEYIHYGKTAKAKTRRIKRFWSDTDLFYLYGVYAAEGSKHMKNSGIKLSGALADKWDNEIERIFKEYDVAYSKETVLPGGKNYRFYARPLRDILTRLVPGNAKSKRFDISILDHSNSEKAIKRLLNGLIDGDGYYIRTADNRIKLGLHTISEALAFQTRVMFIDLYGVSASVTAEKNLDKSVKAIHVTVNGKESSVIAKDFGYSIHHKNYAKDRKNSWSDGKYIYIRIKEVIISDNEADIYAQQVSGNHTFCVAMFATHNTWLPHDPDNYWRDFSIGDPYASIERGYYRLPGEGYAELFPELKGLDPNDYPDIFKYKILSDVAMGSNEYYAYKDEMERREEAGVLTDYEQKIYRTVKNQELEKSVHKKFAEDLSEKDLSRAGIGNKFMAELWAGATRLAESPTESLTFFRPAAKFLHQRTAVEDYIATQVEGSDVGMWTKPYAHFIKPFANKISPVDIRPKETQEKEAINTYFDKLEYVKNRRLYKEAIKNNDPEAYRYKKNYQTTITGALTTGLDSDMEVTRAYVAMPANERAYFAAFSSETEEKVRKQIVNITSADIASLYSKIWERRDAMATSSSTAEQEERIRSIVQQEEQEAISDNRGVYDRYQKSGDKSSTFLEYLEDVKAEQYISQTTGMPSDDFVGWDPRIDIKDIKLQTLTIGKEDVREFGFWDGDEERLKRLTAVQQEEEITGQIAAIKDSIKREKNRAAEIKQELYSRGINVSRVSFYTSKTEDLNINIGA